MRREWPNGGSYFALVPQRATNDSSFLSTAPGLPFFSHRSVNLSTDLPVFQTDLTQLMSTDKKPAYQNDEYDDHMSSVVRLSGGDGQPRFANDSLVNVKDDDFELFRERTSPPQSFPEDLTVTRRPDIYHEDPPTPTSTCVDSSVSPDNSNAVDVNDEGRNPYLRQGLPTRPVDETNSETTRTEENGEYDACLRKPHHHILAHDISTVIGREPEDDCDEKVEHVTRQPEMTLRDDDEVPTDLSLVRRSPSSTDVKYSNDISVGQTNGTSFPYPDSDDNSNSVSASSSSDTSSLPLERGLRRIVPGQREGEEAAYEGSICPHFQKLQEFRRIVLRFVNAFAPNSLGISDKDESFAETDLIDEIVHAAMFNDVE